MRNSCIAMVCLYIYDVILVYRRKQIDDELPHTMISQGRYVPRTTPRVSLFIKFNPTKYFQPTFE